jgi:hypothetical protein
MNIGASSKTRENATETLTGCQIDEDNPAEDHVRRENPAARYSRRDRPGRACVCERRRARSAGGPPGRSDGPAAVSPRLSRALDGGGRAETPDRARRTGGRPGRPGRHAAAGYLPVPNLSKCDFSKSRKGADVHSWPEGGDLIVVPNVCWLG